MVVLLLIAILLTLLFGSAWIGGLVRNIMLFAALLVAAILLERIGISLEVAIYVGLGFLVVVGGGTSLWMNKLERERKDRIKARGRELAKERAEARKAEP